MTTTLGNNTLSEDKKNDKNRRHPGLEINTSKTNTFFNMSDHESTPRPPPSISRKISIRQQPTSQTIDFVPPKTPTSSSLPSISPIVKQMDYEHYTNRFSNILSSRQSQVESPHHISHPTPFPIINEDELHSLPTPLPPPNPSFVFPSDKTPLKYVSFQSDSPKPSPLILSDQPSLGEDYVLPHLIPEPISDEEMLGKEIGSFRIIRLLGVGAFSKVYLAQHIESLDYFAIKTIHKSKVYNEPRVKSSIEREVGILKYIQHSNIVHLEATMETDKMMCIVLEYVEGGELFEAVKILHNDLNSTSTSINEDHVKELFLQLLHSVQWLHENNIVHRDLKLENILIHKENDREVLKITDFGLARVIDPENPLLITRCGSEEYAAPEIIQQQPYDGRKSDTWSLGIILYALLVGYLPFRYDPRRERVSQLFYRIVSADVKWPKNLIISNEAKYVVQSILQRNPEKRISIKDIEHLAWFKNISH